MQTLPPINASTPTAHEANDLQTHNAPIRNQDVVGLFDYLEDALLDHTCEHSFHFTEAYLAASALDTRRVLPWLRSRGATCDCEVLGEFEFGWRSQD